MAVSPYDRVKTFEPNSVGCRWYQPTRVFIFHRLPPVLLCLETGYSIDILLLILSIFTGHRLEETRRSIKEELMCCTYQGVVGWPHNPRPWLLQVRSVPACLTYRLINRKTSRHLKGYPCYGTNYKHGDSFGVLRLSRENTPVTCMARLNSMTASSAVGMGPVSGVSSAFHLNRSSSPPMATRSYGARTTWTRLYWGRCPSLSPCGAS